MTEQERFWSKVAQTGNVCECWEWKASGNGKGYGSFALDRRPGEKHNKTVYAHRYAYESTIGPAPKPFCLDHLCRNRGCVNPWHLELVTYSENILRGDQPEIARNRQISKTHCPRGHEYAGENLLITKLGRRCRTCTRERDKERKRRYYWERKARVNGP